MKVSFAAGRMTRQHGFRGGPLQREQRAIRLRRESRNAFQLAAM
jgi:hypothetical protein